ncbi:MAG TPA: hypothetical protein GXX20_00975 [Clostridiaceae bacterium]|nr:hypothetical protein [Clostridiaceae bacterium]
MNWLRNFMTGRYGGDHLSIALLILSILLTFFGQILRFPFLMILSYIPMGICVFRTFSKNINKRRMENYKFMMLMSPVYAWFNKLQKRIIDSKTHKYFKCPKCKATLRLPKGKGKILIICPKCRNEFTRKT